MPDASSKLSYHFRDGFITPFSTGNAQTELETLTARLELHLDRHERLLGANLQAVFTPASLQWLQAHLPAMQAEISAAQAYPAPCLEFSLSEDFSELPAAAGLEQLLEAGILKLENYAYQGYRPTLNSNS